MNNNKLINIDLSTVLIIANKELRDAKKKQVDDRLYNCFWDFIICICLD